MKTCIGLITFLLVSGFHSLQAQPPPDPDPSLYIPVDQEAKPINYESVLEEIGYPPEAIDLEMEGRVYLRILVDKHGRYKKHIVLKSPHPLFRTRVEKHIRLLRFEPAYKDDRPVMMWITLPFTFKIPKPEPISVKEDFGWEQITEPPKPLNLSAIHKSIQNPELLIEAGTYGKVILKVLIDKRGNYKDHIVIRSPSPLWTTEIEKHIINLKCKPASANSKPVEAWIAIPFSIYPPK